jgi:hypothetical protein
MSEQFTDRKCMLRKEVMRKDAHLEGSNNQENLMKILMMWMRMFKQIMIAKRGRQEISQLFQSRLKVKRNPLVSLHFQLFPQLDNTQQKLTQTKTFRSKYFLNKSPPNIFNFIPLRLTRQM